MKQSYIMLLLAVLIYACGGADGEDGTSNSSASSSKAVAAAAPEIDAKKIWKIRCRSCHGLYGDQGLNGAANLQEVDISLAERIQVITNGKQGESGVMTAFEGILTPEEIEAVAKHTMTFNPNL